MLPIIRTVCPVDILLPFIQNPQKISKSDEISSPEGNKGSSFFLEDRITKGLGGRHIWKTKVLLNPEKSSVLSSLFKILDNMMSLFKMMPAAGFLVPFHLGICLTNWTVKAFDFGVERKNFFKFEGRYGYEEMTIPFYPNRGSHTCYHREDAKQWHGKKRGKTGCVPVCFDRC